MSKNALVAASAALQIIGGVVLLLFQRGEAMATLLVTSGIGIFSVMHVKTTERANRKEIEAKAAQTELEETQTVLRRIRTQRGSDTLRSRDNP